LDGFDRMDALFDIDMDDLRDMNVKRGHAKMMLAQINLIKASELINNKQEQHTKTQSNARSLNRLQSSYSDVDSVGVCAHFKNFSHDFSSFSSELSNVLRKVFLNQ